MWVEVLCWIDRVCACDPSVHRSVPSIGFIYVFVCRKFPPYLIKSLRDGSQVFSLLMLFLCVPLHTMWLAKSLQLLCILPFGMLCMSAISMMRAKTLLAVCMLVGTVV